MTLIIYMALCAAYAGGSMPGSKFLDREVEVFGRKINFTWLPEVLFAIPFGFVVPAWASPFAVVWAYLWMQTATAPALHWGGGGYNPDRTSTLKPFVDWINEKTIKADPSTVQYCRLYMGVKGFLIGLPAGFGSIVTALLWPACYEFGARTKCPHWVAECLTGALAALSILMVKG